MEVLRGVDLEVRAKAVTSVIGPSGAGKTTLLQILGSLSRPDSGEVLYDDVDISQLGDAALSRFRSQRQFWAPRASFIARSGLLCSIFLYLRTEYGR